jgi:hypothetical protein
VVEQILAHELNPFLRDSVLPLAGVGSPHDLRAHSLERPDDLAVELMELDHDLAGIAESVFPPLGRNERVWV